MCMRVRRGGQLQRPLIEILALLGNSMTILSEGIQTLAIHPELLRKYIVSIRKHQTLN